MAGYRDGFPSTMVWDLNPLTVLSIRGHDTIARGRGRSPRGGRPGWKIPGPRPWQLAGLVYRVVVDEGLIPGRGFRNRIQGVITGIHCLNNGVVVNSWAVGVRGAGAAGCGRCTGGHANATRWMLVMAREVCHSKCPRESPCRSRGKYLRSGHRARQQIKDFFPARVEFRIFIFLSLVLTKHRRFRLRARPGGEIAFAWLLAANNTTPLGKQFGV